MEVHPCGGLLHISRVIKANCHPNATITDNHALLSLQDKVLLAVVLQEPGEMSKLTVKP